MTTVDTPVTPAMPALWESSTDDRVRHPPRTPPTSWWQSEQSSEELLERLLSPPFRPDSAEVRRSAQRGLAAVLGWLEQQRGETWQDRWKNSKAEHAGRDWIEAPLRQMQADNRRLTRHSRNDVLCAMRLLLCGQVIRPAYSWLLRYRPSTLLEEARRLIDPTGFVRLRSHCEATGRRNRLDRMSAFNRITWILLNKGGAIHDITVGDCVELNTALREHQSRCADSRHLFYAVLAETGVLPAGSPPTLKAAQMPGQLTVTQLVDRHGVQSVAMRGLLVSYLAERAPEMDYISLDRLATTLCGLFWRDLERHHPGIDSLRLEPEVAVAWKERLGQLRDEDGRVIRNRADPRSKLLIVRAFYLDIARWAAEDPGRWGPWAAPCPIKASECSLRKVTARRKAAMDQRTRARLPVLPTLVRTAEQQRQAARARLEAALATPAEEVFETDDGKFRRRKGEADRVYVTDLATGRRRDFTFEDDRAFWSWATIEVLRHTGCRIEEMLELTHQSFVAYKLPSTGEVVPMLQIVPSKTDSERLLLVSPELGEVFAEVIHRVREGRAVLPLVAAYDPYERTWSPPMPFLFQRRRGSQQRALSRAFIRRCLNDTLAASGLTDATGTPLFFTPHDFRRLFATDVIRSGLPPHIAARILGHVDLGTTMGYAAVYSEDVVSHHRAFIARRRALRPGEEYHDMTPEEWDSFLHHFELRKVALGVCTRDFGSPCAHEHSCIRCPLLRPDPDQMPRLVEIRDNLQARISEAKRENWLGEVAGLEATLAAAEQKLDSMRQLAKRHGTTQLGMPDFRTTVGRATQT